MATANGIHTPPIHTLDTLSPAPSDLSANKRKRDDADDTLPEPTAASRHQQKQEDILAVLHQYDTKPSLLEYHFDSTSATRLPVKKPKLSSSATETATISSKLQDGAYPSLQLLLEDVAYVRQALTESVRVKGKESESGRVNVEGLKQIQRVEAFATLVQEIVDNESSSDAARANALEPATNGLKTEVDHNSRIGAVLTLFGNAPTPKQLFSSMQYVPGGDKTLTIKTELPIEEMSLPNGLTATRLMTPAIDRDSKGPTFEEAFPPPHSLPPMNPPKTQKRSSARDNTITWEFKDVVGRGSIKNGYTAQTVTVGQWLSYGGKDFSHSPREKRKQRDRALSGGDNTRSSIDRPSQEDVLAKEEEALFRRAFSSFAPIHDNTRALVPEETKSMLWWQKAGEARFNDVFAVDPALLEEVPGAGPDVVPAITTADAAEEEDFESALKNLDGLDEEMPIVEQVQSKTDVDQVLSDISQLLETLSSHQRNRNASLPAATSVSRNPISPAPTLAARIGKPDEPSDDEVATYHSLKRELCYLILKLPPYAVAKLDGQQLAALGVNKLVTFEPPNIRGTMEDDHVARLAKYNSMATAAGIATLTRGTSSTTAQHYSTTAQRTPAIGQAANTRHGASSTPATQPQYQRPSSHQTQHGTPGAGGSKYSHPAQYNKYRSTGAPQQSSYSQPATQQYYRSQPTPGGYGGYNQQYGQQATPQTQSYSSQSLAQFQQRSQAAASNAVAYKSNAQGHSQSPFPSTASPAKPDYMSQSAQPLAQRSTYSTQNSQYSQPQPGSGRATPVYPSSQPHTPVNGFSIPPPQQRALPQAVAPRPASSTPQPQQVNGHS